MTSPVTAATRAIDQAQSAGGTIEADGQRVYARSEAILVTDAAKRIVSINRAFTTLTGYALADVQGRNPSLLSAGRTSPEEYAEMWRAIDESGAWQGEIWGRRKDGSSYPKWLAISTLRNAEGCSPLHRQLHRYIGSQAGRAAHPRTGLTMRPAWPTASASISAWPRPSSRRDARTGNWR
ncbi:MAG: PAS domain S-box protein [Rhodocyclaceae bacterium]|nr:PAS domain S-box protein [Rhodocyclaceae bacterium]